MTRGISTCSTIGAVCVVAASFLSGPGLAGEARAADDSSVLGQGGGSLIMVLDGSGSMAEPSGLGGTRMEAAQEGLRGVIEDLPEDSKAGLRVYGSTISDGEGSCEDTELLAPVEDVDKAALNAGVEELKPLGNTPIAYSLEQAYEDLPAEGPRSIVLVSDGEENCGGDPCEVAAELKERGADFYVDVVGLQVKGASRNQLNCIASAGGGTYYDVQDLATLRDTLTRTAVRAARGYEPAGLPIEGGEDAGSAVEIEDGQWLDTIGDSGDEFYALPDPGDGGTVHVSASTLPHRDTMTDAFVLKVDVVDASGTVCSPGQQTVAQGASNGIAPVTALNTVTAEAVEECGEGRYAAQVTSPDVDDVQGLEVLIRTEPGVEDVAALPAAPEATGFSDETEGAAASGEAQSAIGGPNFSSAPETAPGTYEDTVLVNETLFYKVPEVGWGQTAVCDVQLGQSSQAVDAFNGGSGFNASVRLYGSLKSAVTDTAATRDEGRYNGEAVDLHVAGPPVTYRSREQQQDALAATQVDGDQWCAVTVIRVVGPQIEDVGEIPLTLTTSIAGEESGAPSYLEEPAESANDQAAADDDSGLSPWWIVAGVLALAAIAAGLFAALRRRGGPADSDVDLAPDGAVGGAGDPGERADP